MLHTEGGVNHVSNVVLQHPFQGGEQVGIHSLNVIQAYALVQQHLKAWILQWRNIKMELSNLVEWHGEAPVNVVSMKESNAHDPTNKMEVGQVIRIDARVCIDLRNNSV